MHCPHVRRDNESAIRHQGSSLNTKAEKQLIESLNALEPTLNTTWFNHFNQEIVVPEESALSRQDILDRSPFKSQRVHGVDLTDSGFVLKSYFLPAIRSELTGIEPQKIIFDGIRKLGSKNENFNCAVDILEKWMIPANGRLMEYWDTVSYDALDAEKARIKVYTGIFVDSLKRVCDIFTLGGLLEGDDIDKGIEFVKILWRDLVDLEPSSSQLKHCMQWVWEIRSDVRYPVPKLYFSAGEIEDHYVSDAVAKILQHIGWHEHVVTHKALMNEAWSVQVLFMCCISMAQDTPADELTGP
ncbi:hypothetical protein PENSTE_c034G09660 [Penicillium steckii]|uniref:Uncharacterized protein n=1 Tax=Penicillium steckii TaxID=303698 RepID=A0A1V6SLG5_9EURO|nr:hypothetical protein PENSTE_c034G09660 [Penicillium steckii]